MNAAQHYREAERILGNTARDIGTRDLPADEEPALLLRAQVHATLALAAVQAMSVPWLDEATSRWRDTFDAPSVPASTSERGTRND